MSTPDLSYKLALDEIADRHLVPDAGQLVDIKIRSHIQKRIMRWVKGPEVLEMGAAEMIWTGEMVARFGHSSIVDGSHKLLDHAKAVYADRVACYESFFEDFVPPDGKVFDTVLATHVLEHVHDPMRVLQQIRRWLAPKGQVVVVVPNATSLHRRVGVLLGSLKTVYDFSERDRVVGHQRVYDLPRLQADVIAAGFKVVQLCGLFVKLIPVGMMHEFSDELIAGLFGVADELPPEMAADIAMVLEAAEEAPPRLEPGGRNADPSR